MKKIARRVQQVKRSIFDTDRVVVYHGDCLKVMASMPEASVDTIITDPPYHLTSQVAMKRSAFPGRYAETKGSAHGFIGKTWDGGGVAFDPETWRATLRVAKPGAHLLAFGGTRTHHRLACAIEDAGWEIRDVLMWVYGCLSEDTEVFVNGRWEHYVRTNIGDRALCYDVEKRKFLWQEVQEVFVYDYDDTAYSIQSDRTDQIVSKNHRCIVEQGGEEVFQLAEDAAREREATVPVLEDLREVLEALSVSRPDRQSSKESSAFQEQSSTQAIRVSRHTSTTLARIIPVHYVGRMWCVRVPTGAFVARRNGKIFITGNSGFPKSLDVSKAIDKAKGSKRIQGKLRRKGGGRSPQPMYRNSNTPDSDSYWSNPATPEAARWQGWGTALKPAWEPIILARKPLDGTVVECALRHGTGALNVDGCRIGMEKRILQSAGNDQRSASVFSKNSCGFKSSAEPHEVSGRWPANVVLQHDARCVRVGERSVVTGKAVKHRSQGDTFGSGGKKPPEPDQTYGDTSGRESVELYACVPGCPVRMLDGQSGNCLGASSNSRKNHTGIFDPGLHTKQLGYADSGGASRFFYTAKASTAERVLGCPPGYQNLHPTVKPLDLCRWLCRLTKGPDGGIVLDPFSGSGSIAVAALLEGRHAIAIELEEESANVTVARVQAALKYGDELQRLKRYHMKGRKKLRRRQ